MGETAAIFAGKLSIPAVPTSNTMLRTSLITLLLLHGIIHLAGFAKAFQYGEFPQLTKDISRTSGTLWLLAALLFLLSAALMIWKKEWWPLGMAAAILSQLLIISSWQDAKYGSIANVIVLIAAVFAFGAWRFENRYKKDLAEGIARTQSTKNELITEADLQHLPEPVQRYLRYAGVLHKPKIHSMKVTFDGEMRDRGKDYFPFHSEQYNFFDQPTRLFFMKAQMFGVTVPGYHAYKNGTASMEIKLFGLIPIIDKRGDILNKAETVTVFNDMCLMAPATLIDKNIQWEAIDSSSAKARFTCNGISISATLFINPEGQLTNFISDDRYAVGDMKQYRFSTPVNDYKDFNGYHVMGYGEAVWHYPEEAFTYGKFHLKSVTYNVDY